VDEAVEVFHLLTETAGKKEVRQARRQKGKVRNRYYFLTVLVTVVIFTVIGLRIK